MGRPLTSRWWLALSVNELGVAGANSGTRFWEKVVEACCLGHPGTVGDGSDLVLLSQKMSQKAAARDGVD
jgi:hypothetical protein